MQIEKASSRELRKIKKIYLEAFPKSERKPFRLMKQKAAEGVMEFLAIREKGKLAGLAITVLYKDMVLLDYFAIEKSFRGQNLGTEALALLKKRYEGRRFFLEIELPERKARAGAADPQKTVLSSEWHERDRCQSLSVPGTHGTSDRWTGHGV